MGEIPGGGGGGATEDLNDSRKKRRDEEQAKGYGERSSCFYLYASVSS